jgi:hypothetical protein
MAGMGAAIFYAEMSRRALNNEKADFEMKMTEAKDKQTAAFRAEELVDKAKSDYVRCKFR